MLVDKISAKMDGIGPLFIQNYKKSTQNHRNPKAPKPKKKKKGEKVFNKIFDFWSFLVVLGLETIKIESGRSNNACRQNLSQNGWIWTTFRSKLRKPIAACRVGWGTKNCLGISIATPPKSIATPKPQSPKRQKERKNKIKNRL